MKYLKIKNNKGFYCLDKKSNEIPIDKISKEDLMGLLNEAIDTELKVNEFMDEFKEAQLGNKVHQIIYKDLYNKFMELFENKNKFKNESKKLYKDAIEKYKKEEKE